jgi:hypothetical protein
MCTLDTQEVTMCSFLGILNTVCGEVALPT